MSYEMFDPPINVWCDRLHSRIDVYEIFYDMQVANCWYWVNETYRFVVVKLSEIEL